MAVAIKQRAHELIEALPDAATWQDLLYAVELSADVEAGLADAKAGRLTESEELRRGELEASVVADDRSEEAFGLHWS
jgi:predicted transcriptional regulator